MKKIYLILISVLFYFSSIAQNQSNEDLKVIAAFNNSMHYERGNIILPCNDVVLQLPKGLKFLGVTQSKEVLGSVWLNDPIENLQGLIFLENGGPLVYQSFGFVITYHLDGYVENKNIDNLNMLEKVEHIKIPESKSLQNIGTSFKYNWILKPTKNKNALYYIINETLLPANENMLITKYFLFGKRGYVKLETYTKPFLQNKVSAIIETLFSSISFTKENTYEDFDSKKDTKSAKSYNELIFGNSKKSEIALPTSANTKWSFFEYLKIIGLVIFILGILIVLFIIKKKQGNFFENKLKSNKKNYTTVNNRDNIGTDNYESEREYERQKQVEYDRDRERERDRDRERDRERESEREREREYERKRERDRESDRRRYNDDY